jgi:Protein of unknown function (DUF938)
MGLCNDLTEPARLGTGRCVLRCDSASSIEAWTAGTENILATLLLDASAETWPVERVEAIICINMVHISPWTATAGLMGGAAAILRPGAPLYLYGPYRRKGGHTAPSNAFFDADLPRTKPGMGRA